MLPPPPLPTLVIKEHTFHCISNQVFLAALLGGDILAINNENDYS